MEKGTPSERHFPSFDLARLANLPTGRQACKLAPSRFLQRSPILLPPLDRLEQRLVCSLADGSGQERLPVRVFRLYSTHLQYHLPVHAARLDHGLCPRRFFQLECVRDDRLQFALGQKFQTKLNGFP